MFIPAVWRKGADLASNYARAGCFPKKLLFKYESPESGRIHDHDLALLGRARVDRVEDAHDFNPVARPGFRFEVLADAAHEMRLRMLERRRFLV